MTFDVKWVDANATALDAARVMRDNSVGFLPICEPGGGRVVAVLTDRDLATRLCAYDRRASETPVLQVATPGPILCHEDSPVQVAEDGMREHQVSRVVVVDRDMRPIGIISLTDVLMKERGGRALPTARGVLEREAGGPHPPLSPVQLTPDDGRGSPVPSAQPSIEDIYHRSGPAQSREDYAAGGRVNRPIKEFPT